MRLATIRTASGSAVCRLEDDEFVALPFRSMTELLTTGDWRSAAAVNGRRTTAAAAVLLPSVEPRKTFCVGLNYKTHIAETKRDTPAYPTLFGKFCDSLTGPYADIAMPPVSSEMDWEVELGVVIGYPARAVSPAHALDHVAGYTVVNDVSMRDWQSRTNQWLQGKTFEASTPVGPYVVTPDEIDHARDLRITCRIGDTTMQDGRTSDVLFGAADLVSYISTFTTLQPGDLIATGTPGGTGIGQHPKRYLRRGEILVSEIEGIGTLVNHVVWAGPGTCGPRVPHPACTPAGAPVPNSMTIGHAAPGSTHRKHLALASITDTEKTPHPMGDGCQSPWQPVP